MKNIIYTSSTHHLRLQDEIKNKICVIISCLRIYGNINLIPIPQDIVKILITLSYTNIVSINNFSSPLITINNHTYDHTLTKRDFKNASISPSVGIPQDFKQIITGAVCNICLDHLGYLYKVNNDQCAMFGPTNVTSIYKNNNGLLILTKDGMMYDEHSLLLQNVTDIACQEDNCLILTNNGKIYVMGKIPSKIYNYEYIITPTELPMQQITGIACGSHHSAVITMGGELYTWGNNGYLQLGQEDYINRYSPTKVYYCRNIIAVSCNGNNTLALDKFGTMMSISGHSKFSIGNVQAIYCGYQFHIYVTIDNEIYLGHQKIDITSLLI